MDPTKLLKSLDPLLSSEGGIKSEKEIPGISHLMKRFSKTLVSACVYCNVLKETQPNVLASFLDGYGWDIINEWLMNAHITENFEFVVEILRLCQILPVTISRLKKNNTAKIIKMLTKSEDQDVKTLALDVMNGWISLIKDESSQASLKKLKKQKLVKRDANILKNIQMEKIKEKHIKIQKRKEEESVYKDAIRYGEIVIENSADNLVNKKPKLDTPEEMKIHQTKSELREPEEDIALPKGITKIPDSINKNETIAAVNRTMKRKNTSEKIRIMEKKIKTGNLSNLGNNCNAGLRKIAVQKSKPSQVLQESRSFDDALEVKTTQPVCQRKKTRRIKLPITISRVPFCKESLEMSNKTPENEKENKTKMEDINNPEKIEQMDTNESKNKDINNKTNELLEVKETGSTEGQISGESSPNEQFRPILVCDKKYKKKKSVSWAEEPHLRHIFYFEMDKSERVNVNLVRSFCERKSLEIKHEAMTLQNSRNHMRHKMGEPFAWKRLIPIDLPASPIGRICNSKQKEIQLAYQQSKLEYVYFSRQTLPETPDEPKEQAVKLQEPKIIPLENKEYFDEPKERAVKLLQEPKIIPLENKEYFDTVMRSSTLEVPISESGIPPVLSNLLAAISKPESYAQPPLQNTLGHEIPSVIYSNRPNIPVSEGVSCISREISSEASHEPKEEVITPKGAKHIPLQDESSSNSAMDSSAVEVPLSKSGIPLVLSNLLAAIRKPENHAQPPPQNTLGHEIPSVIHSNYHPNIPASEGVSYILREMSSEAPDEPKEEVITPKEPKIIPLQDESSSNSTMDSSAIEAPLSKPGIPPVLLDLLAAIRKPESYSQPPSESTVSHETPRVICCSSYHHNIPASEGVNYLPREIPETPDEPKEEIITPKLIPLENEGNSTIDFSAIEILPEMSNFLKTATTVANPKRHSQPPPTFGHDISHAVYSTYHPNIPVSKRVKLPSGLLGNAPPGYEPIVKNRYINESSTKQWHSKFKSSGQYYSNQSRYVHKKAPARNKRVPFPRNNVKRRMNPLPIIQVPSSIRCARGPQRTVSWRGKKFHASHRNFRKNSRNFLRH